MQVCFIFSDDNIDDDEEEVVVGADVKGEILETGQEVLESAEVDPAVYQCLNCPRKFHRRRGLERHKTVHIQFNSQTLKKPKN